MPINTVLADYDALTLEKELIKLDLKSCWEIIVKDISGDRKFRGTEESLEWLEFVLESNVPFGKQNRALAAVCAYRQLVPEYTLQQDFRACVAAWCFEIMQTVTLMADDIMDCSLTRRGRPCWYLRNDVGANKTAFNDCFLLECFANHLLRKHVVQIEHKHYPEMIELFQETALKTVLGQCMDLKMELSSKRFESFTMERYSAVVQFKTSCNAFYAPIAAAMIMAGKGDEWLLSAVEEVTKKMGFYFQVQDDYLDCYGDPEETGKIGSDIENAKCTWLILKTLEVASQAQATKLEEIYFGVQNDETVQNVKDIFQEVGLPALYEDFEEEQQNAIIELIHELPNEIPKLPFRMYAAVLFGRTK